MPYTYKMQTFWYQTKVENEIPKHLICAFFGMMFVSKSHNYEVFINLVTFNDNKNYFIIEVT